MAATPVPLILYPNMASGASATLATANPLYANPPLVAGLAQKTSLVGTSTGFGEFWSQGNAGPWAAGALNLAIAPTGNGRFLDGPVLTTMTLLAGLWTDHARGMRRELGGTIIPSIVRQRILYVERALGSTIVYENRVFIPRALGGVYIPDTSLWVPRAFGGTIQVVPLAGTLAGTGTLTGALSLSTALSSTLVGVGTRTGTLSANTALSRTFAGAGTLAGAFSLMVATSVTFAGIGALSGTLSLPAAALLYLSAPCVTRDMQATANTRDMIASAITRDERATANARDEQATATTRDEKAIAKTRS